MVKGRYRTLWKTVLREIRDSLGRYLAIVGIIALGSGFFTGLRVCKTAMLLTGQDYMDRTHLNDYRLLSTVGWGQENVEAIAALKGVETARGAVTTDFLADCDGSELVLKAHTITPGVNEPELTSGRMPEAADEILLDGYALAGISLGSRIRLSGGNDPDTAALFRCEAYTVVGMARSPLYINFERGTSSIGSGTVAGFVYLLPEGFTDGVWTELDLTLTEKAPAYSAEYDAILAAVEPRLTVYAQREAEKRYEGLKAEAETRIADGERELADGEARYQEGLDAWLEAQETYLDGRAAYEDGLLEMQAMRASTTQQLRDGYYALMENEKKLDEAQKQLDEGRAALRAALPDLKEIALSSISEAERMLDAAAADLDGDTLSLAREALSRARSAAESADLSLRPEMYDQALSILDRAGALLEEEREQLDEEEYLAAQELLGDLRSGFVEGFGPLYDAYLQLERGQAEIDAGRAALAVGWQTWAKGSADARAGFADAEDQLEIARLRLEDGRRQLEQAQAELEEAELRLREGRQQLDDAREQLEKLESPQVFVLDRSTNVGYVCFASDSDIVAAIATVFPFFFFAVAALVCITTISRMVDEERGQIGILKALGYGEAAIMSRYLIYTGTASLLGCAVGVVGGSWVFPEVIWKAYGIMYNMPPLIVVFDGWLMLLSTAAYLTVAMLVTWFGCRRELREPAAELIRPKSPPPGKRVLLERVGFLWKRLSFLRKVSVRNVFRYSKRLVMMVLGIGGCTALLLTGLGLNDSITHLADQQFSEISLYEGSIQFTEDMSGEKGEAFLDACGGAVSRCVFLYNGNASCTTETHSGMVTLAAPPHITDLEGLMSFHLDGRELEPPGPGECFVSKNLSDRYGLGIGDEITLTVGETDSVTMRISGVFANVIYNYVFTDLATLQEGLTERCELKMAYVDFAPELEIHEAAALAAGQKGAANVSVTSDMRDRVNSMLGSMRYVVLLVIGCAAALAFIVLFNLTNINIQERLREIATLKVLGFTREETAQYVLRENLILTLCGAAAGIPMGIWLHNFVMAQIKIDMISFEVRRSLLSYGLAVGLTFCFTLAVNLFMLPRLERINMTEALKSVE